MNYIFLNSVICQIKKYTFGGKLCKTLALYRLRNCTKQCICYIQVTSCIIFFITSYQTAPKWMKRFKGKSIRRNIYHKDKSFNTLALSSYFSFLNSFKKLNKILFLLLLNTLPFNLNSKYLYFKN